MRNTGVPLVVATLVCVVVVAAATLWFGGSVGGAVAVARGNVTA